MLSECDGVYIVAFHSVGVGKREAYMQDLHDFEDQYISNPTNRSYMFLYTILQSSPVTQEDFRHRRSGLTQCLTKEYV